MNFFKSSSRPSSSGNTSLNAFLDVAPSSSEASSSSSSSSSSAGPIPKTLKVPTASHSVNSKMDDCSVGIQSIATIDKEEVLLVHNNAGGEQEIALSSTLQNNEEVDDVSSVSSSGSSSSSHSSGSSSTFGAAIRDPKSDAVFRKPSGVASGVRSPRSPLPTSPQKSSRSKVPLDSKSPTKSSSKSPAKKTRQQQRQSRHSKSGTDNQHLTVPNIPPTSSNRNKTIIQNMPSSLPPSNRPSSPWWGASDAASIASRNRGGGERRKSSVLPPAAIMKYSFLMDNDDDDDTQDKEQTNTRPTPPLPGPGGANMKRPPSRSWWTQGPSADQRDDDDQSVKSTSSRASLAEVFALIQKDKEQKAQDAKKEKDAPTPSEEEEDKEEEKGPEAVDESTDVKEETTIPTEIKVTEDDTIDGEKDDEGQKEEEPVDRVKSAYGPTRSSAASFSDIDALLKPGEDEKMIEPEENEGEQQPIVAVVKEGDKSEKKEADEEKKTSTKIKEKKRTVSTRPVSFTANFGAEKIEQYRASDEEIISNNTKPTREFEGKFSQPKSQIKELILAAKGPSLPRRTNACGTIKVLAAQKKNVLLLARTEGLLASLVFVMSSQLEGDIEAGINARTRATNALLMLSQPKDNRRMICEEEGILESLVKVINEDSGEARVYACSTLATLAKTEENRIVMMEEEILVPTLCKVIRGLYNKNGFIRNEDEEFETEDTDSTKSDSKDDDNSDIIQSGSDAEDSSTGSSDVFEFDESRPNAKQKVLKSNRKEKSLMSGGNDKKVGAANVTEKKFLDELSSTRVNACAALLHMTKQCSITARLCDNDYLVQTITSVCRETTLSIHSRCIEILCNLTRFPGNIPKLNQNPDVLDVLSTAIKSTDKDDRIWSIRALQNVIAGSPNKGSFATTSILDALGNAAMNYGDEQEAAVGTLLNLAIEPSAIVQMTNTKNVVGALVHVAYSDESSNDCRVMACDAIGTMAVWLQTLAGAAKIPTEVHQLPLPTLKATSHLMRG